MSGDNPKMPDLSTRSKSIRDRSPSDGERYEQYRRDKFFDEEMLSAREKAQNAVKDASKRNSKA